MLLLSKFGHSLNVWTGPKIHPHTLYISSILVFQGHMSGDALVIGSSSNHIHKFTSLPFSLIPEPSTATPNWACSDRKLQQTPKHQFTKPYQTLEFLVKFHLPDMASMATACQLGTAVTGHCKLASFQALTPRSAHLRFNSSSIGGSVRSRSRSRCSSCVSVNSALVSVSATWFCVPSAFLHFNQLETM